MTTMLTAGELSKSDGAHFRFTDINPITRRAYAASKYRDLPSWAIHVVNDAGVRPSRWNDLVSAGLVLEQPAFSGEYRLTYDRDEVESLRYAELAMALAASGADLPRDCSREQTFALAALGVARMGVDAIRAANKKASAMRLAGDSAAKLYGGKRRENRAHDLASFATVLYGTAVTR